VRPPSTHTGLLTRLRWLLLAGVLALTAFGCGGRTSFDGTRFEKESAAYRIGRLPPTWERVKVDNQDLAFAHKGEGTIAVHSLCEAYDDLPHAALLNHLLFGFTHRRYVLEEEVVLDGRGALHAIVDAELDGVPVQVEVYILTRNGCVFDLLYVSGLGAPARVEFEQFARAFAIERARGE